jgi:uncharacterized protein YutE (UPF0331/DUF86 family)
MADPVAVTTAFWDLKASEVLKFVSELISALAWPLSAFLIVNLFKKEIVERIPRMSELTLPGGISAKFNEVLNKVEAEVTVTEASEQQAASADANSPPTAPAGQHDLRASIPDIQLNQTDVVDDRAALRANPTGVVMEAWQEFEDWLSRFAERAGVQNARSLSPSQIAWKLRESGLINTQLMDALIELQSLRNLVAHTANRTVSEDEVTNFVTTIRRMRNSLLLRLARHLAGQDRNEE